MGRRLVRYDCRGVGVSDHAAVIDADLFAADLETVADAAGLRAFDLYGFAQGAVAAVMFAARHPERVRRLVLQSSYALGWLLRGSPREIDRRKALITLATSGWKQDNLALRRMFSEFYIPGGTEEQRRSFDDFFQAVMAERNMSEVQHVLGGADIRSCAEQITAPTLVLHSRGDAIIPLSAGQEVAKLIPGSRFVTLDSANHLLLDGEPAWERMVEAVEAFLE
jgi:pimeloyl-ACP methyl ester carboxylesterase